MTWRVEDDGQAGWALRKLAGVRAEIERVTQLHKAEKLRLDEWAAATLAPLQTDQAHWEDLLIDYRNQLEAIDPNLRPTYRLPDGELVHRKGRERVTITDPDELIAWARINWPDLLKIEVYRSKLHESAFGVKDDQIVTGDGVILPGVRMERGDDEITITTTGRPFTQPDADKP